MIRIILAFLTMSLLAIPGFAQGGMERSNPVKVGVILSGCGIQDGTEIFEAALTILALEKENAQIILMAPDINQSVVVNHLQPKEPTSESRNVLVESARIARGKIQDIKNVSAKDIDVLIIVGGLGALTTLSDLKARGAEGSVLPDVEMLVRQMHDMKKPVGSMCLASLITAKVLGADKVKITIGAENKSFGPNIMAMGAVHVVCDSKNIVVDEKNLIVTTPAYMGGPSNADMSIGIEKMVHALLAMTKR